MTMLRFQRNVIQATEKLGTINELRTMEHELGLSEFQRGQLSGAQQVLYWLTRGFNEPVRAFLTEEQLSKLPPFVTSDK